MNFEQFQRQVLRIFRNITTKYLIDKADAFDVVHVDWFIAETTAAVQNTTAAASQMQASQSRRKRKRTATSSQMADELTFAVKLRFKICSENEGIENSGATPSSAAAWIPHIMDAVLTSELDNLMNVESNDDGAVVTFRLAGGQIANSNEFRAAVSEIFRITCEWCQLVSSNHNGRFGFKMRLLQGTSVTDVQEGNGAEQLCMFSTQQLSRQQNHWYHRLADHFGCSHMCHFTSKCIVDASNSSSSCGGISEMRCAVMLHSKTEESMKRKIRNHMEEQSGPDPSVDDFSLDGIARAYAEAAEKEQLAQDDADAAKKGGEVKFRIMVTHDGVPLINGEDEFIKSVLPSMQLMGTQAASRQTRQARGHQVDSHTFLTTSETSGSSVSTVQVKLTGERTIRDMFTQWEEFGLGVVPQQQVGNKQHRTGSHSGSTRDDELLGDEDQAEYDEDDNTDLEEETERRVSKAKKKATLPCDLVQSLLYDSQKLLRFVVPQTRVNVANEVDVHSIDIYLDVLSRASSDAGSDRMTDEDEAESTVACSFVKLVVPTQNPSAGHMLSGHLIHIGLHSLQQELQVLLGRKQHKKKEVYDRYIPAISTSIAHIMRRSQNAFFREQCLRMLQVDRLDDVTDKVEELLGTIFADKFE